MLFNGECLFATCPSSKNLPRMDCPLFFSFLVFFADYSTDKIAGCPMRAFYLATNFMAPLPYLLVVCMHSMCIEFPNGHK